MRIDKNGRIQFGGSGNNDDSKYLVEAIKDGAFALLLAGIFLFPGSYEKIYGMLKDKFSFIDNLGKMGNALFGTLFMALILFFGWKTVLNLGRVNHKEVKGWFLGGFFIMLALTGLYLFLLYIVYIENWHKL